MKYILDTNICIYITKQKPIEVFNKFSKLPANSVGMSLITYAELKFGALKSQNSNKATKILEELSEFIPVLEISNNVADHYAEIRQYLFSNGTPIGNNDLWIAAHVRSIGKILVSNNLKEFNRVPNLLVENWV